MTALLLSGGLDSSAIAAWKRPKLCLTVDYGQRPAEGEIAAAAGICKELKLKHEVIKIDLSVLGSGSLSGRRAADVARAPEWWPFRNQMLLTVAGMRLVPKGFSKIMIGAVKTDVHRDGRAPFLNAINAAMSLQEGHLHVVAPARSLTTAQLLKRSNFPKWLLPVTFSCHVLPFPCGRCRGCKKHEQALRNFSEC